MSEPESDDPFYRDLRLYLGARFLSRVTLLLDSGAGVNSRDRRGMTPLMWAAVGGNVPSLRLLLEYGADINAVQTDGCTALMISASYGHAEAVKFLIENGAEVNARDNRGQTALDHIRFALYKDETIEVLQSAGCTSGITG